MRVGWLRGWRIARGGGGEGEDWETSMKGKVGGNLVSLTIPADSIMGGWVVNNKFGL